MKNTITLILLLFATIAAAQCKCKKFAMSGGTTVTTDNCDNLVSLSTSATDVTCQSNNSNDGTVIVNVDSGLDAPYTYVWSNGGNTNPIINLPVGDYTVTITDVNGCTGVSEVQGTADENDCGTTCNIDASVTTIDECNNNGEATVTHTGGTAPFTYLWSTFPSSTFTANTQTITGLSANVYQVIVTDSEGCTDAAASQVNDVGGQGKIFGYSAIDKNLDGILNSSASECCDSGLNGLEVELYEYDGANWNLYASTSTGGCVTHHGGNTECEIPVGCNHNGCWDFQGLCNGTYRVQFKLPSGYSGTPMVNGFIEGFDYDFISINNINPGNFITSEDIVISTGAKFHLLGAGYISDSCSNGIQDGTETGVDCGPTPCESCTSNCNISQIGNPDCNNDICNIGIIDSNNNTQMSGVLFEFYDELGAVVNTITTDGTGTQCWSDVPYEGAIRVRVTLPNGYGNDFDKAYSTNPSSGSQYATSDDGYLYASIPLKSFNACLGNNTQIELTVYAK